MKFSERKHFYFRRLGLFGYLLPKRDVRMILQV